MTDEKKAEFVRLYAQLDPADRELLRKFIDALAAGDTETVERMEREAGVQWPPNKQAGFEQGEPSEVKHAPPTVH